MYEAHYGLSARPFSMRPDPTYLYLAGKHALALTLLRYGIADAGLVTVLTGEVGVGKTLLVRTLLAGLDRTHSVGMLNNTHLGNHAGAADLMAWVNAAFGLPHEGRSEAALHDLFPAHVVANHAAGKRTLVVVDEAQNLDATALERLRLLTNLNVDHHDVLHLLIVGQPELRRRLQVPGMRQLRQRIGVDYHLPPFGAVETRDYVRHRLAIAGGSPDLFSDAALAAVQDATGGLPRAINVLCEFALVYGFAADVRTIDAALVAEVVRDRRNAVGTATSPVATGGPAAELHAAGDAAVPSARGVAVVRP